MESLMKRSSLQFLSIVQLASFGCAAMMYTNMTPAALEQEPSITYYQDPDADFSSYRTFTVIPPSLADSKYKADPIKEKQLLFALRNRFEERGYDHVDLKEKPDFLATMISSSKYQTTYVAPTSVTLPKWVPGKTTTSYGSNTGNFNYSSYGDYSSYGWGNFSGTSTETKYEPGYMTSETYTTGGYNVGFHYPSVAVVVYDSKTLKSVWSGNGAGTSKNPDDRISSQLVTNRITSRFPFRLPGLEELSGEADAYGYMGFSFGIYTNDGNTYAPVIFNPSYRGPAARAGIRDHDILLSIDGVSLVNKSHSYVNEKLKGIISQISTLEIFRLGQRITVKVQRVSRSDL